MYRPFFVKMMQVSRLIQSSGAVAALATGGGRDGTVFVQGLIGYRTKDQAMIPDLQVAREDFLRVMRLAEQGRRPTLELQSETKRYDQDFRDIMLSPRSPGRTRPFNPRWSCWEATLDSWAAATGATDNGAGCIIALEAVGC